MLYFSEIVGPYSRRLRALEAAPAVRKAIDALLGGAPQEAADALSAMLAAGSRDPQAHAVLGFIAYQGCQIELAARLLESAVALDPSDAYSRALLGTCHLALERHAEAIGAFRQALQLDPALQVAHWLLWSAVEGAGRLDAAVRALKAALLEHAHGADRAASAAPKRRIEDTTLCVVDCVNHALAERALRRSMAGCEFDQVKFLSDRPCSLRGVVSEPIAPLRSAREYSHFVLKQLAAHVDTDHVLLVQWDGYVVNPAAWSPEFLLYDYIGARWSHAYGRTEPHHNVGNGGFSLRSRGLLEALRDPAIEPCAPEDQAIGRRYRGYLEQRHGIAYAPDEVADRFAFEHIEPQTPPFGFHGVVNLARFVDAPGFARLDYFFGTQS